MAWQVSKRVWDNAKDVKLNYKVMLLALADKADENGICWPKYDTSYKTLGDMVGGLDRRSAMRLIDNLVEAGHVIKRETVGRGNSNIFLVVTGLSEAEKQKVIALIGDNPVTITNEESEKEQGEMVTTFTPIGDNPVTNSRLNGDNPVTQSIMKNPTLPTKKREGIPPAILAYQEIVHQFPAKANWPQIVEDVGQELPALARWREVIIAWIGCGWNPRNVAGMLEHFRGNRIPSTSGKRRQPDSAPLFPAYDPATPEPERIELTPEEKILEEFKEQARQRLGKATWDAHISGLSYLDRPNGRIRLACRPASVEWLESERLAQILDPIAQELSPGGFEYVVT